MPSATLRSIIDLRNKKEAIEFIKNEISPDRNTIVVNCIGKSKGDLSLLKKSNFEIPDLIGQALARTSAHFVHLGSAAEYGTGRCVLLNENSKCTPLTDYGKTKLRGSKAALMYPNTTVLRPFNIFDLNLPADHVLLDLRRRVYMASSGENEVRLINPRTTRDFISKEFLVRSILCASDLRATGTFNICSGSAISYGEIVSDLAKLRGINNPILIEKETKEIDYCVGNPKSWWKIASLMENTLRKDLVYTISAANIY